MFYLCEIKKNIYKDIAGGAGFIELDQCECLLHQGYQIICLDLFRTESLESIFPQTNNPYSKLVGHECYTFIIRVIDGNYN